MERKAAETVENAETKKGMTETWMRKHDLLFIAATRNAFTQAIRDATLDLSSFKNWLVILLLHFKPFLFLPFLGKLAENLHR